MAGTLGTVPAVPCPQDTYRSQEAQYTLLQDAIGLNCTACPFLMKTLAGGATQQYQCLVPPGHGIGADNATAAPCATGTYNPGWNLQPCVPCGAGNLTTDGPGATSADDCKVPAGYGTSRSMSGVLAAAPCPAGTYGRSTDTYGLVDVECTKCLEYTTTAAVGSTTGAQCLTLSGYGWDNGQITECDYGYYSSGNSQDPCSYCGEGYNTSTGPSGTTPVTGASSNASCVIAAGWTADGSGGVKPCMQGTYKSLLGSSACVTCPNGTTTTITFAPARLSDCDACRPGYGVSGSIDLSAPACTACPSGTYSFGYVSGGSTCQPCPAPDGYTGLMVSRKVRRPLLSGALSARGRLAMATSPLPFLAAAVPHLRLQMLQLELSPPELLAGPLPLIAPSCLPACTVSHALNAPPPWTPSLAGHIESRGLLPRVHD
jgi:ferredoxin-like protein FixX